MYDTLLRRDPTGKVIPNLGLKWDLTDPLTLRIQFKSGMKFDDGSPVTAADVKASMELYAQSNNLQHSYYTWLDHVTVVDSQTIDVVAKSPYRLMPSVVAYSSYVVPVKDASIGAQGAAQAPGSGPYEFVEFVPNDHVTVKANPAYSGAVQPRFSQITFRQIKEESTRVAALETNDVDYINNVPPERLADLESKGFKTISVPSNRSIGVSFNLAAKGPWQDARVRQALNYAVDRDTIRKALLAGGGANLSGPFAPTTAYFKSDLATYNYDPNKAKQLLSDAGVGDGFKATIATPTGQWLKDSEITQAVAGQLAEVGVQLTINAMEFATWVAQVRTGRDTSGLQYGMTLASWNNILVDPDFGLVPFDSTSSWNLGSYSNSQLQDLLSQGRTTSDESKLDQIYGQAQQLVWNDAPWLFLFLLPLGSAYTPKLSGVTIRPDEYVMWHPDVQLEP